MGGGLEWREERLRVAALCQCNDQIPLLPSLFLPVALPLV